ncbi:MAG TPA: VanZ family protein [Patescibacteria group bacterium]|nr:VanZ family protein [Patescibacteria group bacterium]
MLAQAILSVIFRLMQFQRVIFLWLPVLVWAGLIFYLSSIPNLAVGEGTVDFLTRKPAHIIEYALLFGLIWRALQGSLVATVRTLYFSAAVFTLLYAVTDEIHQLLTPSRAGKIEDLGFDVLGIFLGAVLLLHRKRKLLK